MKEKILNYFQLVCFCSIGYIIAAIIAAAIKPAEYATIVHPHEAALYITIMVFVIGPALLALTDTIIDFVREKL